MRIRDSKNLKYDKTTKISTGGEDYDKLELQPRVCILESFERMDDTLVLYFKNKTHAIVRAQNTEGGREIDLVAKKLPKLLSHSYEEILETDLTEVFI